jgi:hypothetical protein
MFDSIALPDPVAHECAATAADALKESHDSPTALEILVPGISCLYATPGNGSVSAQEGEAPISGTMNATIAAIARFCNFTNFPLNIYVFNLLSGLRGCNHSKNLSYALGVESFAELSACFGLRLNNSRDPGWLLNATYSSLI